ncbi:MAG: hypothetical protein M1832_001226 [Thelocarpon impressellum]|nr:MAG: hypothetical protein M1832_001226 [Thelocarpon impressellum]
MDVDEVGSSNASKALSARQHELRSRRKPTSGGNIQDTIVVTPGRVTEKNPAASTGKPASNPSGVPAWVLAFYEATGINRAAATATDQAATTVMDHGYLPTLAPVVNGSSDSGSGDALDLREPPSDTLTLGVPTGYSHLGDRLVDDSPRTYPTLYRRRLNRYRSRRAVPDNRSDRRTQAVSPDGTERRLGSPLGQHEPSITPAETSSSSFSRPVAPRQHSGSQYAIAAWGLPDGASEAQVAAYYQWHATAATNEARGIPTREGYYYGGAEPESVVGQYGLGGGGAKGGNGGAQGGDGGAAGGPAAGHGASSQTAGPASMEQPRRTRRDGGARASAGGQGARNRRKPPVSLMPRGRLRQYYDDKTFSETDGDV